MSFQRHQGSLHVENIPLSTIATQVGTPCYVYSRAQLTANYQAMDQAFAAIDHQICFAVKSCSNLAILNLLAKLGAGFDIVTGGELARVLAAGGDPAKTVFSGLGKSVADIRQGLEAGIACFNIESEHELERINETARSMNQIAPVAFRVNPNVDAQTHPYISTGLRENKFGIPFEDIQRVYARAASLSHVKPVGIDCHIGSQLTDTRPFVDALEIIAGQIGELRRQGIELHHIDIGGGLGICYNDEIPPAPQQYADALLPRLQQLGLKVYMEPGRVISASAGVLLTAVDILKPTLYKNFAVVDAAMNDLIRPALYQSWMRVESAEPETAPPLLWDIVGAICETGDFLAKDRLLGLEEGQLLAIRDAGAYGFVMSSNYNSRPRAPEVLVDGSQLHVIRQRETVESLWQGESIPGQ